MQRDFEIGNKIIKPGQNKNISLPLIMLSNHHPINIDIKVLHGRHPGKTLFLSAAIHGDELNGIEVIRRVINSTLLKDLSGTIIAIPIVNIFGFINQTRYLPDRRDLNRSFPGSPNGPLSSQLAHFFMEQVVKYCTHGIDIHTGSGHRKNLPQVRCDFRVEETKNLAVNFGAPIVLKASLREGSLREQAEKLGIPTLLFEGGEAFRLDAFSIRTAYYGIIRTLVALDMLPHTYLPPFVEQPIVSSASRWIRAPISGLFRSKNLLGKKVYKGDIVGRITDPLGKTTTPVIANFRGVVIGQTQLPTVYQGDAVVNIAWVPHPKNAQNIIEEFEEENGYAPSDEEMRY